MIVTPDFFLLLAMISFSASFISLPLIRFLALKFDIVDKPDKDLKKHKVPIPYLGGVAIFIPVLITFLFYFIKMGGFENEWRGLFFSSLIIIITGVVDDLKKIKWYVKLFGQMVSAIILISFGMHLKIMFYPAWLNILITFFWIIMVTNAINIIDIMDGLAASISIIAFIAFLTIGFPQDNLFVIVISVVFISATLPFFFWNFPPAKIFLGDTGALLLGFILAVISIEVSYTNVNTIALLAPAIILGIPLFDLCLVTAIRFLKRIPIVKGSPDHLALRLRRLGMHDTKILLLIDWFAIFLAIAAVAITFSNDEIALALYFFIAFSALVFGFELSKIDMKPGKDRDDSE
ncbi:MAG TPA: undecaprenyl/decaprenyl-phosphate alpha-N-acetylglucosaminyl 1-phosphate transferase [Firmicutes bacterium]|nr:undecaprenyl/decaprenyl-phosphate alpha-N-acetylglucosaminyl 1-phosphate transferase [Bacillota bacterium]